MGGHSILHSPPLSIGREGMERGGVVCRQSK